MKKFLVMLALYTSSFADTVVFSSPVSEISQITKSEIRSLYSSRSQRLLDGQKVVLFQMPETSREHYDFVNNVLGISIKQYSDDQNKLIEKGIISSIKIVKTKQEMLYFVSLTYNGVGYLDSDYLIVYTGKKDVKEIRIVE